MKNISYLLFCAVLFAGCNNIETKIRHQIERECINKNCSVDISKSIPFDWDKLIVFNSAVSPEAVDKAIGTEYHNYADMSRQFIFLKNNKIVHSENNEFDQEVVTEGQVRFACADSLKYATILHNKTIFKVKRMTSEEGVFYFLSQ